MYQSVILVGNCTRDTEVRYLQSGTAVATVGIAINRRVKKNEEWIDDVTFLDVTCWGKTAETAGEYCVKGKLILIDGELRVEKWETPEGEKRSKVAIHANSLKLLGGAPKKTSEVATETTANAEIHIEEGVPF